MRCIADFRIDSDLCLGDDEASLQLNDPEGEFLLTISNAGAEQPDTVLSAQMVFEAASFDNIRDVAIGLLVRAVNALAYTTNRKFSFVSLSRIVDWTPGLLERRAILYKEKSMVEKAEPALDQAFMRTPERFLSMQKGDAQQAVLRWYRLGIEEEDPEAQFSYFWFALEIVSETMKGIEKVHSKCPKCQSALFCETCGNHPMHRRYAGDAIQKMIALVHPENVEEVFQSLQLIRHTLMHGKRISAVADQLPCTQEQAINRLALITWHAIQ